MIAMIIYSVTYNTCVGAICDLFILNLCSSSLVTQLNGWSPLSSDFPEIHGYIVVRFLLDQLGQYG